MPQCLSDLRDQIIQPCMHLHEIPEGESSENGEEKQHEETVAQLQIAKEFSMVDRVRHTYTCQTLFSSSLKETLKF